MTKKSIILLINCFLITYVGVKANDLQASLHPLDWGIKTGFAASSEFIPEKNSNHYYDYYGRSITKGYGGIYVSYAYAPKLAIGLELLYIPDSLVFPIRISDINSEQYKCRGKENIGEEKWTRHNLCISLPFIFYFLNKRETNKVLYNFYLGPEFRIALKKSYDIWLYPDQLKYQSIINKNVKYLKNTIQNVHGGFYFGLMMTWSILLFEMRYDLSVLKFLQKSPKLSYEHSVNRKIHYFTIGIGINFARIGNQ